MSFVQKYCLQLSLCVEDCSKMLGIGNGYLPQSLLTSITELILVSAQEIPELVSALEEQLGPLIRNEDTGKLLGTVRTKCSPGEIPLKPPSIDLTDLLEVRPGRNASQSEQRVLPFQIDTRGTV